MKTPYEVGREKLAEAVTAWIQGLIPCTLEATILSVEFEHEGGQYAVRMAKLNAELPKMSFKRSRTGAEILAYKEAQRDMLKDDWVKAIEKGE